MIGLQKLILALAIGAFTGSAAEVKIIANPSIGVSSVTSDELKGIFLATKSSLGNGSHVEPVLLKSGSVHDAFLRDYVGKTDATLEIYYRSLVFTGKASMPKAFATDAQVVSYVESTKGAIGYVSAGASTGSAKVMDVR